MSVKKPAIAVENLTFERNGEVLFDDFSFEIQSGSYVAIIGPNGGGKTTLVRIMLGLTKPTAGAIRIFGVPIDILLARRRIGYVPQFGGLLDANFPATADEVVSASRVQVLGSWRRFGPADAKAVASAFKSMEIERLRERTIASLSGGERQRVLLARALAAEADILVLDEPMGGLDPASREDFYASLRKLNKSGKTILFVTHDVHRIAVEADSAICLRHELVCHGSKACLVTGQAWRNIYHANKAELSEHAD
ncbi:metal ABC transporter ATP-binding protein [Candidatus Uhrbacteria bacterium]|nr:metal ABC transporter ATP-binding protein [Candidatus Uhrbacteria bacterium]